MASSKELKLDSTFKKIIKNLFNFFGYEIKRKNNFFDRWENFIAEANDQDIKDLKFFSNLSLATQLNLWSIKQSIIHIFKNNISGDIVECGVYNGYTLSYIGKTIEELNIKKNIIESVFISLTNHP